MHNVFLSDEGTESTEENDYVQFSYTSGIVDMTSDIRLSLDGHFYKLSFSLTFNFNLSIFILFHIFRIAWFHQVL